MGNFNYDTKGNIAAEELIFKLENLPISGTIFDKIENVLIVILSNPSMNEDWIEEEIEKVKEGFEILTIFTEDFKEDIILLLKRAKEFAIVLN